MERRASGELPMSRPSPAPSVRSGAGCPPSIPHPARPFRSRPARTSSLSRWHLVLPGVLLAALGMLVLAAGCQRAVPPASASAADESSPGSAATPDHDSHGAPKAGTSGDVRGQADRIQARQTLMVSITIFVLSIFVGVELITKVPATLHTPLMSGSNAISGITVVGAVIAAGSAGSGVGAFVASAIGLIAVILATINVVGGFLVTHRMLRMFDRR